MNNDNTLIEVTPEQQKKHERNVFIFLTVFLAPILSVAIVGALGFIIWFSQLIFGSPGV